jgi:hypothetical protein
MLLLSALTARAALARPRHPAELALACVIELELELVQSHMAQKPVLWGCVIWLCVRWKLLDFDFYMLLDGPCGGAESAGRKPTAKLSVPH